MRILGSNMSYLSKMYYFLFFSINQVNLSYSHLLENNEREERIP